MIANWIFSHASKEHVEQLLELSKFDEENNIREIDYEMAMMEENSKYEPLITIRSLDNHLLWNIIQYISPLFKYEDFFWLVSELVSMKHQKSI